jgi:hypothetical protein
VAAGRCCRSPLKAGVSRSSKRTLGARPTRKPRFRPSTRSLPWQSGASTRATSGVPGQRPFVVKRSRLPEGVHRQRGSGTDMAAPSSYSASCADMPRAPSFSSATSVAGKPMDESRAMAKLAKAAPTGTATDLRDRGLESGSRRLGPRTRLLARTVCNHVDRGQPGSSARRLPAFGLTRLSRPRRARPQPRRDRRASQGGRRRTRPPSRPP